MIEVESNFQLHTGWLRGQVHLVPWAQGSEDLENRKPAALLPMMAHLARRAQAAYVVLGLPARYLEWTHCPSGLV